MPDAISEMGKCSMAHTVRRCWAAAAALPLVTTGLAVAAQPALASDWSRCLRGSADKQTVFARASEASGVPEAVLLGVSYMESRWDEHGAQPSTSGGYGPMHLVDPALDGRDPKAAARGETGGTGEGVADGSLQRAAALTGYSEERLRTDEVANICGGAALLASYQRDLAPHAVDADAAAAWSAAIARYSGAADEGTAGRFVAQVFTVLRDGQARTTDDGQRVRVAAHPAARPDAAALDAMGLERAADDGRISCPKRLGCVWVPAPYKWYDKSSPVNYGNHDLADRPAGRLKINYIVIHDTEATWRTTLHLIQDPTYVSWHYSLRSSDGRIAEHVDPSNVAWHAGNWYINMHAIGLEHEGFGEHGSWFTEAMYQSSATLVRYLAHRYGIPLDRAHIIGHDQVPGTVPSTVAGMHWDPGPYWDWEHYFHLLGKPIARPHVRHRHHPIHAGRVVTVAPGFDGNRNRITGCSTGSCVTRRSNFVYLHTKPSRKAPLVPDRGSRPGASSSTTGVSDIGARVTAGQKLYVARRSGEWLGVWYLGALAWLHDPKDHRTVMPSGGDVVVPKAGVTVPVYGRAYPEQAAYPAEIPYQTVTPLQYTFTPGQAYVLADRHVPTDYYYAKTFNCGYVAKDCTDVVGKDRYYQVWFGHRQGFVRAADVEIREPRRAG
jgi:hypothetical protein